MIVVEIEIEKCVLGTRISPCRQVRDTIAGKIEPDRALGQTSGPYAIAIKIENERLLPAFTVVQRIARPISRIGTGILYGLTGAFRSAEGVSQNSHRHF